MSAATLHIEKKMTSVPKLRFPGFEGEWEENTTKIQIIAGNAYSLNDYKDNGVILIQGLNIAPGRLDIAATNYISEDNNSKHVILSKGDILLGLNRPVTNGELKVCRYNLETKGYLYQRAGRLQFNFESIYPDLLYQYLRSDNFLKDITNELVGSDQPYIRSNLFEIVCLTFPTLPEQQKIASFLSSVDEKIQQLSRKKEILEQYKKGVMQQLFSGKLRFKDNNGEDYADWEEKKLGEVGKFYAGGDLDKLNYSKTKSEEFIYPIYANGSGEGIYGYATTFQYKKNSVTVSGRGNLGYANIRTQNFNAIVRLIVIEPKDNINSKYLEEIINQTKFAIESTGVPQLTVPQIKSYKISIPSLPEQQKIAHFLSGIDGKIEQVNGELVKTQLFKKGLLQQMFV